MIRANGFLSSDMSPITPENLQFVACRRDWVA